MYRIGSLFSGIGGLELGIERAFRGAGWLADTRWQVEIDPFCRRVLERHWPNAQRFNDVFRVSSQVLEPVDIMCGGFPCQDLSVAGNGAGLDGARSGLFWRYARLIREMGPRVVVLENVSGLLARGLGRVLGELASIGYDAEWDCIPAASVGAPHQRDRVFIVAHAGVNNGGHEGRPDRAPARDEGLTYAPTSDAVRAGLERASQRRPAHGRPEPCPWNPRRFEWGQPPSSIRRVDDGLPAGLDRPRRGRRPDNDKHRLKALGNAVVPQVAEIIGARVLEILRAD